MRAACVFPAFVVGVWALPLQPEGSSDEALIEQLRRNNLPLQQLQRLKAAVALQQQAGAETGAVSLTASQEGKTLPKTLWELKHGDVAAYYSSPNISYDIFPHKRLVISGVAGCNTPSEWPAQKETSPSGPQYCQQQCNRMPHCTAFHFLEGSVCEYCSDPVPGQPEGRTERPPPSANGPLDVGGTTVETTSTLYVKKTSTSPIDEAGHSDNWQKTEVQTGSKGGGRYEVCRFSYAGDAVRVMGRHGNTDCGASTFLIAKQNSAAGGGQFTQWPPKWKYILPAPKAPHKFGEVPLPSETQKGTLDPPVSFLETNNSDNSINRTTTAVATNSSNESTSTALLAPVGRPVSTSNTTEITDASSSDDEWRFGNEPQSKQLPQFPNDALNGPMHSSQLAPDPGPTTLMGPDNSVKRSPNCHSETKGNSSCNCSQEITSTVDGYSKLNDDSYFRGRGAICFINNDEDTLIVEEDPHAATGELTNPSVYRIVNLKRTWAKHASLLHQPDSETSLRSESAEPFNLLTSTDEEAQVDGGPFMDSTSKQIK